MFKLFIICIFGVLVSINIAALPTARIIGGWEVDILKHPYLVSIRYRSQKNSVYVHRCAGVIYNERVVITGAQCVVDIMNDEKVLVVAGANSRTGADGLPYPAFKWVSHSQYSSWTVDYDIGLLIIDDVFDFTNLNIKPIAIKESRPVDGKMGTVAGWGYREEFGPSSSHLEEVQVPIVRSKVCTQSYGAGEITDRMICAGYLKAGGKDACQGDTGGPLVVDNELVGLVSWGRGCARPNYPSVYTFVGALKEWIDETIAANLNSNMRVIFYITVLILAFNCLRIEATKLRTVGDFKASHITQFPFEVSIRRRFCDACAYEHYCGGTIYSDRVIITAASCVKDADVNRIQVVAGTSKRTAYEGEIYLVEKFIEHELDNVDLALLHLRFPIKLNGVTIDVAKLATELPKPGQKAVVAGWGQTSEGIFNFEEDIKAVQVPIVDLSECQDKYFWTKIHDNEICAGFEEGGVDACRGDAGSPLLVNEEVVGVVSWGYGCARPNNPGVYTNVVTLRSWIEQHA
ncbi:transmembrane protease serine 9-like [Cochliomyia hominivorax]